jgi:sterol desaturase/sphingolipid hydroxylase (fatty acid hydroxylase superfamily)
MGTYIHSGYCFPIVNRILLVGPRDHDRHHVKKVTNYGLGTFFSLTDRLFGRFKEGTSCYDYYPPKHRYLDSRGL